MKESRIGDFLYSFKLKQKTTQIDSKKSKQKFRAVGLFTPHISHKVKIVLEM